MSLSAFQLNGKNALVTGSHRGLGTAIALALAEADANVACHDRDPRPGSICADIQALGRHAAYFAGELAEASAPL
jgi:2-dehydro-3-deoxy-D-gluconate 5-dehydrogenase